MSGMLDKIARAIGDRAGRTEYGPVIPEALLPDLARSALLAMREIDKTAERAMCVAIEDTPLNDDPSVDGYDLWTAPVRAAQVAMIDSILAGETGK